MPLKPVVSGNAYNIWTWVSPNGGCSLEDFFRELRKTGHKDLDRVLWLLKRTADHGPPKNIELVKALEGKNAKGLFEFKANAVRVLWFYDKNRIIICSHGFLKKSQKTPKKEIEKAKETRRTYFNEPKE